MTLAARSSSYEMDSMTGSHKGKQIKTNHYSTAVLRFSLYLGNEEGI